MENTQYIAITFENGTVGIMAFLLNPRIPANTSGELIPGYNPETGVREPTDEAIWSELSKTTHWDSNPVSFRLINMSEIPSDRYFRNAWKDTGTKIDVDMVRARNIQREVLRTLRAPKLEALDVEYMKALETNNRPEMARITVLKQQLRDITDDPRIEAAQTPEELKAITIGD